MSTFRRWLAAVAVVALSVSVSAEASQVLEPGDPLHLTLQSSLDAETAKFGDPFEGVLKEDYQYKGRVLPAGTVLKGVVKSANKSHTMGFPGYVTLDIQEAVLPDGTAHSLDESVDTDKIMHPKAKTHLRMLKSAIPFSAVSAADGIPLKYAAGLSTWQILPISLAARMGLGVTLEAMKSERKMHADKGHTTPTQIGHGVLRGTGLTGAYYFFKPSPEPNLQAGNEIPLHLDKQDLDALFSLGGSDDEPKVSTTGRLLREND